MTFRPLTPALAVVLALFGAKASPAAPAIQKTLTGSVTDGDGHPLRRAIVKLENMRSHQIVSYITNAQGHYRFRRVAGDVDYEVWASYHGHSSSHGEISHLDTGEAPTKDLSISLP